MAEDYVFATDNLSIRHWMPEELAPAEMMDCCKA